MDLLRIGTSRKYTGHVKQRSTHHFDTVKKTTTGLVPVHPRSKVVTEADHLSHPGLGTPLSPRAPTVIYH